MGPSRACSNATVMTIASRPYTHILTAMVRCRLPISSRPDNSAAAPAVPGAALGRLRAALFFVMGPSATRRLPREQASL